MLLYVFVMAVSFGLGVYFADRAKEFFKKYAPPS